MSTFIQKNWLLWLKDVLKSTKLIKWTNWVSLLMWNLVISEVKQQFEKSLNVLIVYFLECDFFSRLVVSCYENHITFVNTLDNNGFKLIRYSSQTTCTYLNIIMMLNWLIEILNCELSKVKRWVYVKKYKSRRNENKNFETSQRSKKKAFPDLDRYVIMKP